jgi:hypothetical protein
MASNGSKTVTPKSPAKPAAKPVAVAPARPGATKPVTAAAKPASVTVPVAAAKPASAPAAPAAKTEQPVPAVAVPVAVTAVAEKVAATVKPVIEKITEAAKPAVEKIVETTAALAPATSKEVTTMEATIKNAADKTQALFADAQDRAKVALEKGQKLVVEMNEFNKGNVEALVESGKIAAKGFESMGQSAADYSRRQFEGATAALKSLSAIKSPTDFFKLHSDYVRSSFDSIVAETSRNTEAMLKLAGEIAQPIQNRVAVAVEKAKIAA